MLFFLKLYIVIVISQIINDYRFIWNLFGVNLKMVSNIPGDIYDWCAISRKRN